MFGAVPLAISCRLLAPAVVHELLGMLGGVTVSWLKSGFWVLLPLQTGPAVAGAALGRGSGLAVKQSSYVTTTLLPRQY